MNRLINMSATSETRSQEVYALPIKQIVVAVDLTARSEKTVEYAIEIARSFGARIHLAYVRTPESVTESATQGVHEHLEEKHRDPEQELRDLHKRTRKIYPNCGAEFRVGNPADEFSVGTYFRCRSHRYGKSSPELPGPPFKSRSGAQNHASGTLLGSHLPRPKAIDAILL
jgi:hypothetical protein